MDGKRIDKVLVMPQAGTITESSKPTAESASAGLGDEKQSEKTY
jgi:hypothetical protein